MDHVHGYTPHCAMVMCFTKMSHCMKVSSLRCTKITSMNWRDQIIYPMIHFSGIHNGTQCACICCVFYHLLATIVISHMLSFTMILHTQQISSSIINHNNLFIHSKSNHYSFFGQFIAQWINWQKHCSTYMQ